MSTFINLGQLILYNLLNIFCTFLIKKILMQETEKQTKLVLFLVALRPKMLLSL